MLEKLKSWLPLLSIGVLCLGLSKQILYYNHFNLPIKYFIGINELGIAIAENIFIFLLLIFLIILGALGMYIYISKIEIEIKDKTEKGQLEIKVDENENIEITEYEVKTNVLTYKSAKFKFRRKLYLTVMILLQLAAIFTLIIMYNQSKSPLLLYPVPIFLASVAILSILLFIPDFVTKYFNTSYKKLTIILTLFFTSFFLFQILYEIAATEKGKYTGTYIKTSTIEHTSNDSSYFIGMTDKYLFIYNKKEKSTDVIPTSSIIEFKLKSK